jgi:alkylation response protein AidB-like acyl-CoA dehydrogenase
VANLSCRATPDGDGWRITGQKMWCTFADGADYLQVFARTSPADPSRKARGISCFMMPKQRGQLPDGVRGTPIRKIGYHGWKTWELSFENAYAETMIGAEGEGFKVAMGDLDTARVHTAARAIGLARAPSRTRPPTRSNASSSDDPSRRTRPSGSGSPTWPRRWPRPAA